jgi:hypothetical protein
VIRIMAVDYQNKSCDPGAFVDDTQVVITEPTENAFAYVLNLPFPSRWTSSHPSFALVSSPHLRPPGASFHTPRRLCTRLCAAHLHELHHTAPNENHGQLFYVDEEIQQGTLLPALAPSVGPLHNTTQC